MQSRLTYANITATVALFVALGGSAVAASTLMNGDRVIKTHSLSGDRLRNHTITGQQVKLSALGTVPSAKTALNATDLGGIPASAYAAGTRLHRSTPLTLTPATNLIPIITNGPMELSAYCPDGHYVAIYLVAHATSWFDGNSLRGSIDRDQAGVAYDWGSPGSPIVKVAGFNGLTDNGYALQGEVIYGVNWPSAGKCSAYAWAIG